MRSVIFAFFSFSLGAAELPQPVVVDPGGPGQPPSDAIVLFDGKDLSQWLGRDGGPARWALEDGDMVCKTGTGSIHTKRNFKSFQLHVEFSTPDQREAKGQARGNSGVYLQGRYELQVLDSYQNPTYAAGSAGSIYQQSPPAVNASRPPETWQSYDVIFHAADCYGDRFISPATVTVLHNGVVIQDHFVLKGPTPGGRGGDVCSPGPILLQDHVHDDVEETALRYRNIWIRPLP